MKKLLGIILSAVLFVTVFSACGKADNNQSRILYGNVDLSKIVELGKYKNIPVDTSSESFKEYYNELIQLDIDNNEFFSYSEKTEGKVANGDIANIDYCGKKDGVAFEGGTAEGYDLEIGSHSFIDGFEDGLIGVSVGETVDLNLTFPENYQSADLAGAAVVFTVKVNYIKTKTEQKPNEYYAKLGFKSVSDYYEETKQNAVKNYLYDTVCANSNVKEYPQEDIETIYTAAKNAISINIQKQYNMSFEDYLSNVGESEESFKESLIDEQIKGTMKEQMIFYAILDKEGIKIEQSDIDAALKKELEAIGDSTVTEEEVKSFYGDYYFESSAVSDKALEIIYKDADIK